MSKARALSHLALVAAAVGALMADAVTVRADGFRPVGMTDAQSITDWSGIYIGGKLGGAWSDVSWSQDLSVFNNGGAAPPGADTNFGPSGIAGGVFGGANLQMGQWIFGAELSYSGVGLSESITSPFFPATDTFSTDIGWLATVEGRIGYSWNRLLVFGKGGWAGGNASLTMSNSATGVTASTTEFVDGWTIGGGLEYAFWPSVIFGIEYDYVHLSLSNAPSCPLCDAGVPDLSPSSISGDANISSVMARASYLFRPED